MYGISESVDLDEIIGSEIQQICCGRYDVQFHFLSGTSISVQGDVTLHEGVDEIGSWKEDGNWSTIAFQRLLDAAVKKYSVPNNRLLQIEFENGLVLQLHDSSNQYESFQITRKDKAEIIVV